MDSKAAAEARGRLAFYWLLVGVLLFVGAVSILTVGMALLLPALSLAGLFPFRKDRLVFWPGLATPFGLILGWVLTVPSRCVDVVIGKTDTVTSSVTSCRAILPISYGRPPVSYLPALVGALVGALAVGIVTWLVLRPLVRRRLLARYARG